MERAFLKGVTMFIRKKKNAGGTTSIMLMTSDRKAGRKHSNLRLLKNFGASKDAAELALFIQKAEEYKKYLIMFFSQTIRTKNRITTRHSALFSMNVGFLDVYGKFFDKFFSNLNLKAHEIKKLHDLIVMRIASLPAKEKQP